MNRRDLLTTAGMAGAAVAVSAAEANNVPMVGVDVQVPPSPVDILRDAPPMNLPRAYEIMEREKLDGIAVAGAVNVFHMTGLGPVTFRMGYDGPIVAILTRDPQRPLALVAAEFTYYYLVSDIRSSYPVEWFVHSASVNETRVFPDHGLAPLSAQESTRAAALAAVVDQRPASADTSAAIVKALRWAGLERGRIAVDHGLIRAAIGSAGLQTQTVDADVPLKRIRMIKSPREIQLMRIASAANVAAAQAAVRTARAGANFREMRTAFYAEAARRGNRGVFMVIDGVSTEGIATPFHDGHAFLIDAVSEGAGYHGDFARTVFIGEPAKSMQKVTAAIQLGWATVRDALKPGMRFSEITALGQKTLRDADYDFRVAFGPHSVGLYHNDAIGLGDIVLEENMVLSVDCPVMEAGLGGSAHLEDLTLITKTGGTPIHAVPEPVLQV